MTDEFDGPYTKYVAHIVYGDYSERTKCFSIPTSKLEELVEYVLASDNVRSLRVAEEIMFCRKSSAFFG